MFENLYKSRMNSLTDILSILLEYGEIVKHGNRIQGYGIYESVFDKYGPKISRRKFGYRKQDLLNSKLIIKLHQRNKKSNYYSITPLGIVLLLQRMQKLDKHQIRKIFEIAVYFTKIPHREPLLDSNLFRKLLGKLDPKLVSQCFRSAIKAVKIEDSEKGTFVYVVNLLPYDLNVIFLQYAIQKSKIYRNFDILYPFSKAKSHEISELDFHHGIAAHIFRQFHIELFKKIKRKDIPFFYEQILFEEIFNFKTNMSNMLADVIDKLQNETAKDVSIWNPPTTWLKSHNISKIL